MQRPIKFRVWHPKSKYWSYWGFTDPGKSVFAGIPSSNEDGFDMEYVRNNSQQFTGLRDKNGNEIFEGDIVKDWRDNKYNYCSEPYVIKWDINCFNTKRLSHLTEVIGNVFENANLLTT